MGRDRTGYEKPDLFSAEDFAGRSPNTGSGEGPILPPPKRILPKDLTKAIGHLDDHELDRLVGAAIDEARRRGRLPPGLEASSAKSVVSSAEPTNKSPQPERGPSRHRQVQIAPPSLTRGQINAVRAAFKAGITPPRIERQFGLTQSDVRKALAADKI